jgi:putative IMPACT (imprinted ancient) family translation regulator
MPILQVLRGAGLSDAVAVVVRWYGGTKLGKGGLARAYAGATREAVAALPTVRRVPTVALEVALPYDRLGAVKRLIQPPRVELAGETYGADVRLTLELHESARDDLEAALADLGLEASEIDSWR